MSNDDEDMDDSISEEARQVAAETSEMIEEAHQRERRKELLVEANKRPRGILSEADRDYICGLKDYKHKQTEANRRQEIRERVINGLHDFLLLSNQLEKEEKDKIFTEEIDEEYLHLFLQSMITFVYTGLDQDQNRLEKIIEKGVYNGANLDREGRWVGEASDVDVRIDIKYNPNIDKLYRQLQQGKAHQLTPAEIGILVQSGRLDSEDIKQLEETDPGQDSFLPSLEEFLSHPK